MNPVRIRFRVYRQRDESGAKNHRIHHESEYFESGYFEFDFDSNTFKSGIFCCVNGFSVNPKTFYGFYGLCVLISYILLANFACI